MSKHQKTLAAMRNNPRDWQIADVKTLAARLGIECRNDGGSHHVFSHPLVEQDVCVPAHRPIKPIYIRLFMALIDKVQGLSS
jgi:predicted RNA binding protein YcfA (HicA-like mRNA interferase family)